MIKTFDNRINIVGDDLKNSIDINSKLSVASSIFTDPTFIKTDQNKKLQAFSGGNV